LLAALSAFTLHYIYFSFIQQQIFCDFSKMQWSTKNRCCDSLSLLTIAYYACFFGNELFQFDFCRNVFFYFLIIYNCHLCSPLERKIFIFSCPIIFYMIIRCLPAPSNHHIGFRNISFIFLFSNWIRLKSKWIGRRPLGGSVVREESNTRIRTKVDSVCAQLYLFSLQYP